MRLTSIALTALALQLLSCGSKSTEQTADTFPGPKELGTVRIRELSGDPIDVSQFQGKVVFLNFWATWCVPCIREMPSIERAKASFDSTKIEFILASNESSEQIRDFLKTRPSNARVARVENFEEIGIQAMPTTMIFDEEGDLVFSETGFRIWDDTASIDLVSNIIATNP